MRIRKGAVTPIFVFAAAASLLFMMASAEQTAPSSFESLAKLKTAVNQYCSDTFDSSLQYG
jgi:hypothetical protein